MTEFLFSFYNVCWVSVYVKFVFFSIQLLFLGVD